MCRLCLKGRGYYGEPSSLWLSQWSDLWVIFRFPSNHHKFMESNLSNSQWFRFWEHQIGTRRRMSELWPIWMSPLQNSHSPVHWNVMEIRALVFSGNSIECKDSVSLPFQIPHPFYTDTGQFYSHSSGTDRHHLQLIFCSYSVLAHNVCKRLFEETLNRWDSICPVLNSKLFQEISVKLSQFSDFN